MGFWMYCWVSTITGISVDDNPSLVCCFCSIGVCIDVEGEDIVWFCLFVGIWTASFVWFCDGVLLTRSSIGGAAYWKWCSVS